MAFSIARKIRSQAWLLLAAVFLLAQPLANYGSLGVSRPCADAAAGSLAALGAGLLPLGPSIQSVRADSWQQTSIFGRGKHSFVARARSIQAPLKETAHFLGTGPTSYLARSAGIHTGRSPPPLFS
jgi:hypothetical protein